MQALLLDKFINKLAADKVALMLQCYGCRGAAAHKRVEYGIAHTGRGQHARGNQLRWKDGKVTALEPAGGDRPYIALVADRSNADFVQVVA